jgi:hypothetical protein
LYAKGDFEMALVYFHRGQTLRPELDDFRLGIQKAREAIDNSIGNAKDCRFKPPPGAKLVVTLPVSKPGQPPLTGAAASVPTSVWVVPKTTAVPLFGNHQIQEVQKSEKRIKQLLGELFADKEYLVELGGDRDFVSNPNANISNLVQDALKYLDTRAEFWRQQKPVYSKKREQTFTKKIPEPSMKPFIVNKEKKPIHKIKPEKKQMSQPKKKIAPLPYKTPDL